MPQVGVNYLAVLAVAVAGMAVGALWYSPVMFGKIWSQITGRSHEAVGDQKKAVLRAYVFSFLSTLIMAWVFSRFSAYLGATGVWAGAKVGFWIWLGFVVTTMTPLYAFSGKPFKLYLIDVAHYLVGIMIIGAILGGWR